MNAPLALALVVLLAPVPSAGACAPTDPPPVPDDDVPCVDVQPGRDPPVYIHECEDPPPPSAP